MFEATSCACFEDAVAYQVTGDGAVFDNAGEKATVGGSVGVQSLSHENEDLLALSPICH